MISQSRSARFSCSLTLLFILALCFCSDKTFAWGERGHDIVTRVAARTLIATNSKAFSKPFQQREFMLGHLSNVPDIIWKSDNVSEAIRTNNRPTHYINLDLLAARVKTVRDIPVEFEQFIKLAELKGQKHPESLGSAPWRVLQLYRLMQTSFKEAGASKRKEEFIAHINSALLYAGLMSHYVGDLANPHHTTEDHDGQMSGNGGLHAYFESYIVDELSLELAANVFALVIEDNPIEKNLLHSYSPLEREKIKNDPLQLIFALAIDSYNNLPTLVALDNRYALVRKSNDSAPLARRHSPAVVHSYFNDFIVQRLALGSSVLAQLWTLAWKNAGSPDMSDFHSFHYPASPKYIYPDY